MSEPTKPTVPSLDLSALRQFLAGACAALADALAGGDHWKAISEAGRRGPRRSRPNPRPSRSRANCTPQ